MAYDSIELGSTPAEEHCEQLGREYDPAQARRECEAYRRQLIRTFGEPPEGAAYRVKGFAHDFGTYYEVTIRFDEADPIAVDYAYDVENSTPGEWDDEARTELGLDPAHGTN